MATAADRKRREERVKLIAQAVSNIGTAFIVAGFVGPVITGRFNPALLILSVALAAIFWLASQGILEYVAEDPKENAPWSL